MNGTRRLLRKLAWTMPGIGLGSWLACCHVQGQAPDASTGAAPAKTYLNKSMIQLPIVIEERHRAQLKNVQLHVKEGPTQPWKLHATVPPSQASFSYKAPAEGEYWFNIVSEDNAGRLTPPDVSREAPALIVVLDTAAPQVDVRVLHSAPEGLHVRCESRDPNLDAFKTRFFYQTGDLVWRALDSLPGKADTFCIPAQAAWTGNVRAHAVDFAGNVTTRELNLGASAPSAPATTPPPPVSANANQSLNLPPAPLPLVIDGPPLGGAPLKKQPEIVDLTLPPVATEPKAAPPLPASTAPRTVVVESSSKLPLPPAPTGSDKVSGASVSQKPAPPLFDPALAANATSLTSSHDIKLVNLVARETAAAQRQYLSTTRFALDYRLESLGASGIGKVEVWCTRDLGQSWQKLCEDADRQSPVDVNLPGEGIFGLCLVVSNGRGFGGTPPNPGDTPDYWVEVDTTKPVAELIQVRHGTGEDGGALQIVWNVREKNLGPDAVELLFAASREGPWQPLAKGLKNEGVYRWLPPADAGAQTFVRLTARDLAGNVATAETTQPVLLDDLSRPRARVLGLSTSAPRSPVQP